MRSAFITVRCNSSSTDHTDSQLAPLLFKTGYVCRLQLAGWCGSSGHFYYLRTIPTVTFGQCFAWVDRKESETGWETFLAYISFRDSKLTAQKAKGKARCHINNTTSKTSRSASVLFHTSVSGCSL